MWSGSGLYATYWNMVKRQLIVSKVSKTDFRNYYSFINLSLIRQGWIDGRKKWKKYEMIRDPGIAFLVALKCCMFLRFVVLSKMCLPWLLARERRMLWGDLKKKSGGHRRYRGKKVRMRWSNNQSELKLPTWQFDLRWVKKKARWNLIVVFHWRRPKWTRWMGHHGRHLSELFHGFDDFDLDQDTEAEERADQQKDRSSARIWEDLRESDLAFLNRLQISCQ